MEFEHLLRKYLAASISDAELQRFRDLLERSPEYRLELRQVLELRSLIQDDALGLAPPENLSEQIQLTVGELFAAENPVRRKREEERRRAVVFPFRIAAGVMATTFVALMVAIGPSMIDRFGNSSIQPRAGVARMALTGGAIADLAVPDVRTAPSMADASGVNVPASVLAQAAGRREVRRQQFRQMEPSASAVAPSQPALEVQHDAIAEAAPVSPSQPSVVLRDGVNLSAEDAKLMSQLGVLNHDNLPYHPQFDDPASTGSEAAAREDMAKSSPMADARDPRRLTVGMMLGSGRVTETQTPTPLIQNSYYFAFNIGSNDRIGLEMGTSAFQQDRSIASFVTPATNGLAKQTSSDDPSKDDGQKGSSSNRQLTLVNERAEQQITYGTIFYDRKMKISDNWDLCGRLGVGAADNALVGHLRAYAAFSPSKKVTLTVGLGGSGLKSLNSRGASGSGNYGVYYGVETGF